MDFPATTGNYSYTLRLIALSFPLVLRPIAIFYFGFRITSGQEAEISYPPTLIRNN